MRLIAETTVEFTSNTEDLERARFHIIAVPTPINIDKTPKLFPVENASRTVGQNLVRGSIVVYESTVYPGVTEDTCIPILEKESGLKHGVDFKVGYSPERINPGDKIHTLEKIVKIVSGSDSESLDEIANVYEIVIEAGVHRASSIRVAEAAKVVENSQRDVNIAFMNELAMVFDKMSIDTQEVINAMQTKWNALGFTPGLVGGHCIGVDPFYFIYEAEKLGYHSQIILSGRKINDGMPEFVTKAIIKKLVKTHKRVAEAKIAIFGVTFKENTPDVRNSKVYDIYHQLLDYDLKPVLIDPVADLKELKQMYGVDVVKLDDLKDLDCIIFAVPHREFLTLNLTDLDKFFKQDLENSEKVIIDIKSILDVKELEEKGYAFWRL